MFRATALSAVGLCVRRHVHPDVISYASIVVAALAGTAFWFARRYPFLLIVAPMLCYARLWCNMLDGMVALASGKASRRGEIVNDLPDRISDILIFAGVAHSGLNHPASGYWAAIARIGGRSRVPTPLLPLHYGFEQPQMGGTLGYIFGFLHSFDYPYNLAPSLHIALRSLIWVVFIRHTFGLTRWGVRVWLILVGLSTLFVKQHHSST
jgi:hypothetical protein